MTCKICHGTGRIGGKDCVDMCQCDRCGGKGRV